MELIADILLVAGALGAGLYCFVLARRLKRFNDLEKGVGGAVAVLAAQVDDLNKSLLAAREASDGSKTALSDLTGRAESVASRLELLMASMHDIPEEKPRSSRSEAVKPPETNQPLSSSEPPAGPMFVRHDRNQLGTTQ